MTALTGQRLTFSRGGRVILKDVDFRAEAGEFVAVIGANGAGKSTLLGLLAALHAPDSGEVRLNDRDIKSFARADIARRRSYLPQSPRCEWPISVERLIALGLTPTLPAFGGLSDTLKTRVEEMLAEWDLLPHRYQPATTLSGGELARAMLARALVANPDIVIADEPIAGLDPKHALDTVARLRSLAQSGKVVIASLHDLTLAARHATRILVLHHGQVAADGTPGDILSAPLLRTVFDVDACVSGSGSGVFVDYIAPSVAHSFQTPDN